MNRRIDAASQLFLQICDLAAAAQRGRIEQVMATDPELAAEVQLLLDADRDPDAWLEVPAYQVLAEDLAPPILEQLPEFIGNYRVLRRVGAGGMGIVFEAEQQAPARRVAVKLMHPLLTGEAMQRRFEYEAEVLGRLQHPGIAQIFEAGTCDLGAGLQPFLAMEFVAGDRLGVYAQSHQLDARQVLEIMVKLCGAVHHAHQKGVIHRDLKPDNILVDAQGRPKVLDFGIARAIAGDGPLQAAPTQSGQVVGTLGYMSPEQVNGCHSDLEISSDVYSLGVICFEMLCGALPHDLRGRSITESARMITELDPPLLGTMDRGLRGDVETVVAKALDRDRSQRYQSAAEFAAEIQRCLDHEPIVARRHTLFYEVKKFARRNRAVVGGAVATLLAIVGGTIGTLVFAFRAADQERLATRNAYSLGVRVAADAVDDGKFSSARAMLDLAPVGLRGWEWHFVDSRLQGWSRELLADVAVVEPICYSPDGTSLCATLADGSIGVWQLATGRLTRPYPVDAKIVAIANNFPPKRARLAAGAVDGRVFVWDSASSAPMVLRGHGSAITALTWTGRGDLLTADRRDVRLWRDGVQLEEFAIGVPPSGRRFGADLVAAPDQRGFSFAVSGGIYSVDMHTAGVRSYGPSSSPRCVVYSPDGSALVVGTEHQNLHILDPESLRRIDADCGHTRRTDRLRYSPDGSLLAAAADDGSLTLRDGRSHSVLGVYACGGPVRGLAFRPDGRQLACAGVDSRRVILWDLPMKAAYEFAGRGGNIHALGWSGDGTMLFAGTDPVLKTQLFDALSGEVLLELDACRPLVFGAGSRHLLLHRVRPLRYAELDLATGIERALSPDFCASVAEFVKRHGLSPGGGQGYRRAVVGPRGVVAVLPGSPARVVQLATGEVLAQLAGRAPNNQTAAFRRDGRLLLTTAAARAVWIHDHRWRKLAELPSDVHTGVVMAADFSPDGRRLVTACHDNVVRLFDAVTWQLLFELEGHRSHVACTVFSPGGQRIASSGGDATVRIWDSVPRAERSRQRQVAAALDQEMARRVSDWLGEGLAVPALVQQVAVDAELTAPQRAAIWRALMRRRRR